MEWQCPAGAAGFYGNKFTNLPFHCQLKALKAAGDKLPWEDEREENPHGVSKAGAGPAAKDKAQPPSLKRTEKLSPEELVRKRALAATGKFDNETPTGSPVLNSQIPGLTSAENSGTTVLGDDPPLSEKQAKKKIEETGINRATTMANGEDCKNFLQDLYIKSLEAIDKQSINDAGREEILKNLGSIETLFDNFNKATKIYRPAEENKNTAFKKDNTITFYRRTFQSKFPKDLSFEWKNVSDTELAQTIIHEAIHTWFDGFTDEFIGMVLEKKDKEVSGEVGNNAINKAIRANCK